MILPLTFLLTFSSDSLTVNVSMHCNVLSRIFDDGGGGVYDAVFDDDDDGLVYAGAE